MSLLIKAAGCSGTSLYVTCHKKVTFIVIDARRSEFRRLKISSNEDLNRIKTTAQQYFHVALTRVGTVHSGKHSQ
jgi:hypothetical protein